MLYLTSANLNKARRIESFSVFTEEEVVQKYENLVRDIYNTPGFSRPSTARKEQKALMKRLNPEIQEIQHLLQDPFFQV